jgi:hypothetical protein
MFPFGVSGAQIARKFFAAVQILVRTRKQIACGFLAAETRTPTGGQGAYEEACLRRMREARSTKARQRVVGSHPLRTRS